MKCNDHQNGRTERTRKGEIHANERIANAVGTSSFLSRITNGCTFAQCLLFLRLHPFRFRDDLNQKWQLCFHCRIRHCDDQRNEHNCRHCHNVFLLTNLEFQGIRCSKRSKMLLYTVSLRLFQ